MTYLIRWQNIKSFSSMISCITNCRFFKTLVREIKELVYSIANI